jgi:Mg-chelatase subunit ChlI
MNESEEFVESGKVILGSTAVGTVDEATVEQRANELAAIEGRSEFNAKDLAEARRQLSAPRDSAKPPEVTAPETETASAWDTAPTVPGERAPTRPLEDEETIGETLVQEGLEEADHERRFSASLEMNRER